MADSENSRTLSSVTRRTLLAIATSSLLARVAEATPVMPPENTDVPDPALSLWRDWTAAHQLACEFGRQQQLLERELVSIAGFPTVKLRIPGRREPVSIATDADIERWLGTRADTEMARAKARTALAAKRLAWQAADERLGYSRALQAEDAAAEEGERLAEALWECPARSIAGATAKLHATLVIGETSDECEEFPWPQLRSVLADLLRVNGVPAAEIDAA
ncbi:MAG: hypothetical protein QHC90_09115 [Shinella sp.]|nr:hypothetical protein [Shinella sp.]